MRLAQLDRAFGYGPKGREFESSNAQYKALREIGVLFSLDAYVETVENVVMPRCFYNNPEII